MPTFKCKMCGGNLEVTTGSSVVTCEYCGTSQTISKSRDEIVSNLYNRANDLRLKCEFDRAEQIYEKILEHDNTEAEAHWGIVLCRYGIEYVEDPTTKKRIPTCHRTSYESIVADTDYIPAIKNADDYQKAIYEAEAKLIDDIQKNILAIAKTEESFDIFICYKETDENGKRTVDSAIANDIYYQLTNEGFKVFYAPITLEDKLGQEYEPYIFSALNSAKVMLVVGTKPEHFNAVWVRNEWSRYLKLLKNNRTRLLVPCYRDMDVYELPEEFAHLQAQDMSKIGFVNDLIRGIKKVVEITEKENKLNDFRANENNIQNKQEKLNYKASSNVSVRKSTKVFSIISGIFFFLSRIEIIYNAIYYIVMYKLFYGFDTYITIIVSTISTWSICLFLLIKKPKLIAFSFAALAIERLLLSGNFDYCFIFCFGLYFELMFVTFFQKNIFKWAWIRFLLVFIIPLLYLYIMLTCCFVFFTAFTYIAYIFYLLYLISANKKAKQI